MAIALGVFKSNLILKETTWENKMWPFTVKKSISSTTKTRRKQIIPEISSFEESAVLTSLLHLELLIHDITFHFHSGTPALVLIWGKEWNTAWMLGKYFPSKDD